jgi:O-methyltransferase domain
MSKTINTAGGTHNGDPRDLVWEATRGVSRFAALNAMAQLNCADHLLEGPLTTVELAERCGANPVRLGRVLRMVAAMGILHQVAPGTYELTEGGRTLSSGAPNSMRSAVLAWAEEGAWLATGAITRTVITGRTKFMEEYGSHYDYLAAHPEANQVFNEFMRARSQPIAQAVTERYDFSDITTLVDVAGGKGTLLAAILHANPHIRGTLLERDNVIPDARENLASQGLADRCELITGSFFESVPKGADAYLLGSIIHNWDDDDALRILGTVRAGVPDHGRVLIVDVVLPDDDRPHVGRELDMRMLVLFGGGRERTGSETFELLAQADLRGEVVAELPLGLSLIEARPGK